MKPKYIVINLMQNKQLNIALYCIVTLMLFVLVSSFSIWKNVQVMQKEPLSVYSVVAILRNYSILSSDQDNLIDYDFMERFADYEYVVDYYGFGKPVRFEANNLVPVKLNATISMTHYSDVSKSTHFTTGDRVMVEGRYAAQPLECNISKELAEANQLIVGSTIEITKSEKAVTYTVVGLFEDKQTFMKRELQLIPNVTVDGIQEATANTDINYGENTILLHADDMMSYELLSGGSWRYGFGAVVYRLRNDRDILAFEDAIKDQLPSEYIISDSLGVSVYIRHIIDKTNSGYAKLMIVVVVICSTFLIFLLLHLLKTRVYDIGVMRARGMSRLRLSLSLQVEIFIIFILAMLTASFIYIFTLKPLAYFLFDVQRGFVSNDDAFLANFTPFVLNEAHNFEFTANTDLTALLVGLAVTSLLSAIVIFATTIFITRHEPMKTMTRY